MLKVRRDVAECHVMAPRTKRTEGSTKVTKRSWLQLDFIHFHSCYHNTWGYFNSILLFFFSVKICSFSWYIVHSFVPVLFSHFSTTLCFSFFCSLVWKRWFSPFLQLVCLYFTPDLPPPPILLTCPQGFSLLPKIWIMAERSLEYAHHVAVTWLQGWCRNGMDRWTGDSTGGIEYSQVFSVALLLTVFNLQLFHMSPALSLRGLFFFPLGFHWVLFVSGMIRCFLSSHCPQSHIFAYTFKFCRSFLWNGLFNCHQLVSLSNRRQILPPTALEQL